MRNVMKDGRFQQQKLVRHDGDAKEKGVTQMGTPSRASDGENVMTDEDQQAEYNKFLGHYAEVHEYIDSLATEYNSIVTMGGPFIFNEPMRLDVAEAIAVLEDLRTKLHLVFLVNAIDRAEIDRRSWIDELAKATKGQGTEPDSEDDETARLIEELRAPVEAEDL